MASSSAVAARIVPAKGYVIEASLANAEWVQHLEVMHMRYARDNFDYSYRDHLPAWKQDKLYVLRIPGRNMGAEADVVGYYIAEAGKPMFLVPEFNKIRVKKQLDEVFLSS